MDPWEIAPGNEKDVSKKFAEASAKEQALMTKMIQENLDISNIYKTGSIIAIKKNSSIVKKNISVLQDGLRLDNQKSIKFDDEDYIILAIQKNGS